jgi:hypothetical protein
MLQNFSKMCPHYFSSNSTNTSKFLLPFRTRKCLSATTFNVHCDYNFLSLY